MKKARSLLLALCLILALAACGRPAAPAAAPAKEQPAEAQAPAEEAAPEAVAMRPCGLYPTRLLCPRILQVRIL